MYASLFSVVHFLGDTNKAIGCMLCYDQQYKNSVCHPKQSVVWSLIVTFVYCYVVYCERPLYYFSVAPIFSRRMHFMLHNDPIQSI